jgi:hypothetical protein
VVGRETIERVLAQRALGQANSSTADPIGWLGERGWQVQLYDPIERFAAYGQVVPPAVLQANRVMRRWLAAGQRA